MNPNERNVNMPIASYGKARILLPRLAAACALSLVLVAGGRLAAEDFLRGDVNGDGVVTLADMHFLVSFLRWDGPHPTCLNAGDLNDDSSLDWWDGFPIVDYFLLHHPAPPAPFPDVGPDPTENPSIEGKPPLDCQSYGGGSPIADPAARIEVQGGFVTGGLDGSGTLDVLISNSAPIAGFSLRVKDQARVIGALNNCSDIQECPTIRPVPELFRAYSPEDIGLVPDGSFTIATLRRVVQSYNPRSYPPGRDVALLSFLFCLKNGTPAGEYPLTLELGELVDDASGRRIDPVLLNGVISVLEEVEDNSRCLINAPEPSPVRVRFKLGDATAAPGREASVPFSIRSNRESQGFAFSVDFDEAVLEATSIEKLWTKPDGTPYEFEVFEMNNQDLTPGNAGVDEGFLVGAAIFGLGDSGSVIPPYEETEVLDLHFRVNRRAPLGSSTEVRFLDGGRGSGDPVENKLNTGGKVITPSLAGSFVFVNSRIAIVPDVTTFRAFIRGDANGDLKVDISDPLTSLGYLFLGDEYPDCFDGADANDDGRVDVTDPIATFAHLFLEGGSLPAPHGVLGEDPTPDALGCQVAGP